MQRRWAKDIRSKQWGFDIIVRINFRTVHGKEPSREYVESICKDSARVKKIIAQVSEEEIIDAYKAGEEVSLPPTEIILGDTMLRLHRNLAYFV